MIFLSIILQQFLFALKLEELINIFKHSELLQKTFAISKTAIVIILDNKLDFIAIIILQETHQLMQNWS